MVSAFVEDDLRRLGRAGATAAMRRFLAAAARGETDSPPRVRVPLRARTLVFTIGADLEGGYAGFRMYSVGDGSADPVMPSQILGLLDTRTGAVVATAIGDAFGAWRTAAIGAVALEEATASERASLDVAIVGAGFQAHHHARAWAATGRVRRFRIHARRAEVAAGFAQALDSESGVSATGVTTARDAIKGADAVLCATTSTSPVFDAGDLGAHAYVATVGPKFGGTHEVPAEAYAQASCVLTDAVAQVHEYETTRGPLPGGQRADDLVALTDVVARKRTCPRGGLRLFVSEGLAGTEVALLAALLEATR